MMRYHVDHYPLTNPTKRTSRKPTYGSRGISLIYILILLCTITILSGSMSQLIINHQQMSLQSHWRRTAEALVDGALEMAINHATSQGGATTLTADCEGGSASAQITPISGSEIYQVGLNGKVFSDERIRDEQTCQVTLTRNHDGCWRVQKYPVTHK